jgi:O-antigen/teichoic acid export membrane protein
MTVATFFGRDWSGLVTPMVLIALRGLNTLSKFALSLYTARYLGLADLGIYGLLVAGVTVLPAFGGFGTNDWLGRSAARSDMAQIAPLFSAKLVLSLAFNLGLQALAYARNAAMGAPVPWPVMMIFSGVALLDHLADDVGILLTYRGHVLLANILFFIRAGLWPIGVIAVGLLVPAARTLEALIVGWLIGLVLMWIVLGVYGTRRGAFAHARPDWRLFTQGIPQSLPFYLKDISIAANLYLDRFLVSLFLGLELTGVYTFFWSMANVIHNLAVSAIFLPTMSKLVRSAKESMSEFRVLLHGVEWRTAGFAIALALVLIAVMPFIIPYIDRPLLAAHIPVFVIVVAATVLRVGVDSYNYVLLALHHDRAIAIMSMIAVPLSAALYTLLMPLYGLNGAAVAYLLTSLLLLAPRLILSRRSLNIAFSSEVGTGSRKENASNQKASPGLGRGFSFRSPVRNGSLRRSPVVSHCGARHVAPWLPH